MDIYSKISYNPTEVQLDIYETWIDNYLKFSYQKPIKPEPQDDEEESKFSLF